jgi:hypothetical protein
MQQSISDCPARHQQQSGAKQRREFRKRCHDSAKLFMHWPTKASPKIDFIRLTEPNQTNPGFDACR